MFDEFKAFAFKGNVIDLAVGVIIGGAFGKIVESLVKNIIMPLISLVSPSNVSYTSWTFGVGDKTVPYGVFLGDIVNFLIVAAALFFFIVKFLGFLLKSRKEQTASPPPPSKEEVLLTEIRDLLAAQSQRS
ncbi:large conductance mechanosensitive channel protein MscL [Planctomicrobium sp. SH668]|uniref:large conductance mechanosensitive channel protein MscL n=1 Tax=Planctomicrobium sp. SH668 TaxID=3448126 RepID=UPI003F5B02EB